MDGLLHQGGGRFLRVLFMRSVYLLDHDDGIVDDQPDRGGDGAKGHDIERIPDGIEDDQGQTERDRDRDEDRRAGFQATGER